MSRVILSICGMTLYVFYIMPRIARVVAKGHPHHVTQRGNYRQPGFEEDNDYVQYLEWLKDYGNKYSLKIWAYCLMSNHVLCDASHK